MTAAGFGRRWGRLLVPTLSVSFFKTVWGLLRGDVPTFATVPGGGLFCMPNDGRHGITVSGMEAALSRRRVRRHRKGAAIVTALSLAFICLLFPAMRATD